jgi:hypothetical protein
MDHSDIPSRRSPKRLCEDARCSPARASQQPVHAGLVFSADGRARTGARLPDARIVDGAVDAVCRTATELKLFTELGATSWTAPPLASR